MDTRHNLTIGVPVHNEAKSLPYFLRTLIPALKKLNNLNIEIIFCVNGCSDNSLKIIQDFLKKEKSFKTNVIGSYLGKMQAQKEIIRFSELSGPIAFLDADILLDDNCLKNLWGALSTGDNLQVVFSKVYPIWRKFSLIGWMQKTYYERDDDVREPRRYIHGRAYILRNRKFFTVNDLQSRIEAARKLDSYSVHQLFIEKGPQIDDIYLSRLLVDKFGPGSIKEVQEARLYFIPPSTIKDCYQEQKRLSLEIIRNNLLFPENKYTQERWFVRKIILSHFRKLKFQETLQYLVYLPLVIGIKKIVRYRLAIGKKLKIGYGKFWLPLESTKEIKST